MTSEYQFVRIADIVGCAKKQKSGLLPISRATFLRGVSKGLFPEGILISPRCRAWRLTDIQRVLDEISKGAA